MSKGVLGWIYLVVIIACLPAFCADPIVSFDSDVTEGLAPLTVNFIASATDTDGLIRDYIYVYEVPSVTESHLSINLPSINDVTSTHDYISPGTYEALFKVWDNENNSSESSIYLNVWSVTPTPTFTSLPTATNTPTPTDTIQPPDVAIWATPIEGVAPLSVTLVGSATSHYGNIDYAWWVPENPYSSAEVPLSVSGTTFFNEIQYVHNYVSGGSYEAELWVRDSASNIAHSWCYVFVTPGIPTNTPDQPTPTNTPTQTPTITYEPVTIIIDNLDGEPTFSVFGDYQISSAYPPYYGSDSYYFDPSYPEITAYAIFRPDLPYAGQYEVRAYWRQGTNRAMDAPYTIYSLEGEKTVRVDQQMPISTSAFYSLGVYTFDSGTDGYVILSNNVHSGYVMADAMKFISLGTDNTPTPFPTSTPEPTPYEVPTLNIEYIEPENIGASVNSVFREENPSISEDGNTLMFSSNRPGSINDSGDLYMSEKIGGIWQEPVHLSGVVNTGLYEYGSWLSSDKKRLYFMSNRYPSYGSYDYFYSEWFDEPTVYEFNDTFTGTDYDSMYRWYSTNDFSVYQNDTLIVEGTHYDSGEWGAYCEVTTNEIFNADDKFICSADFSLSYTGTGARTGLSLRTHQGYNERRSVGLYFNKEQSQPTHLLIETRQSGVSDFTDLGVGDGTNIKIEYERPNAVFYVDDVEVYNTEYDLFDLESCGLFYTKSPEDTIYATMDNWHIESHQPEGWKQPVNLGYPLVSANPDIHFQLTEDEEKFYFSSRRPDWSTYDIYVSVKDASGSWEEPQKLGYRLNTVQQEKGPSVNLSENIMTIQSEMPGGIGSSDLYISQYYMSEWQAPVNLGPLVNSEYFDGETSLAKNGKELYFTSDRTGSLGYYDIWFTRQKGFTLSGDVVFSDNSETSIATIRSYEHSTGALEYFTTTSPGGGSFDLSGFSPGTYDLVVSSVRYATDTTTLSGITIINSNIELPNVILQRTTDPLYKVKGTVAFEDGSDNTYAMVTLYENDTDNMVDKALVLSETGSFEITEIPDGIYDLVIEGPGYKTDEISWSDVIVNGADAVLGSVTMEIQNRFVWKNLQPSGTYPLERRGAMEAYDPVDNCMYIFGGQTNQIDQWPHFNDLHRFDFDTNSWTLLNPGGDWPAPRRFGSIIFDASRRQVVVFGGVDPGFNNCYSYDVSSNSWSLISQSGTIPPAGGFHSSVYDASGDRMLLYGGNDNTTYSFDLENHIWTLLDTSGDNLSAWAADSCFRQESSELFVAGYYNQGIMDTSNTPLIWNKIPVTPLSPRNHYLHAVVYDTCFDRFMVYGGRGYSEYYDEVNVYDYASSSWIPVSIQGDGPGLISQQCAVFNTHSNAMVTFGGLLWTRTGDYVLFNQVYSLFLKTGSIAGRITDSLSGLPIPGVEVSVSGYESIYSNENGFYEFFVPEGVLVDMVFSSAGCEQVSINDVSAAYGIINHQDIQMTSTTLGTLRGKVLSAINMTPVFGATVNLSGVDQDTTDTNGNYRIDNIPGGSGYQAVVSAGGYLSKSDNEIDITPGLETIKNYKLLPQYVGILKVTVLNRYSLNPIVGAQVSVTGIENKSGTTNSYGECQFFLYEDSDYNADASADGYIPDSSSSMSEINVSEGGETEITLHLTDSQLPPASPKNLILTEKDMRIDLDWDDNSESDLDGYYVYRSESSGSYGEPLNTNPVVESYYIDSSIENGIVYYYQVKAVDTSESLSDPSNEVSGSSLDAAPEPVDNLRAFLLSGAQIRLEWQDSPSSDIYCYNIYWDSASGIIDYATPLSTVIDPLASWVSSSLIPDQTYTFGIRAEDLTAHEEMNTNVVIEVVPVFDPSEYAHFQIVDPAPGIVMSGNELTVMAELMDGARTDVKYVDFQYKPLSSGSWQIMTDLYSGNGRDWTSPYYVFWDTSSISEGTYRIRAIGTDSTDQRDPFPVVSHVEIKRTSGGAGKYLYGLTKDIMMQTQLDVNEFSNEMDEHVKKVVAESGCSKIISVGSYGNRLETYLFPKDCINPTTFITVIQLDSSRSRSYIGPKYLSCGIIRHIILDSGQINLSPGEVEVNLFYPDGDNDGLVDGTTIRENTLWVYHKESMEDELIRISTSHDLDTSLNRIVTNNFNCGYFAVLSDSPLAVIPAKKKGWLATGLWVQDRDEVYMDNPMGLCNNGSSDSDPFGTGVPAGAEYLAPGLSQRGLVGKLGIYGSPFDVTGSLDFYPNSLAQLYLGYNENQSSDFSDNSGSFTVLVSGYTQPTATPTVTPTPTVTNTPTSTPLMPATPPSLEINEKIWNIYR